MEKKMRERGGEYTQERKHMHRMSLDAEQQAAR